MKKFAEVVDNLISNITTNNDEDSPDTGWIDVTGVPVDIGWPVVSGVPVVKPSRWHTVTAGNDAWEITTENQTLKDAYDAEQQRGIDIATEQQAAGMNGITVQQAKDIITARIDIVRALPDSNLAEIQAKIDSLADQVQWLCEKIVVYILR